MWTTQIWASSSLGIDMMQKPSFLLSRLPCLTKIRYCSAMAPSKLFIHLSILRWLLASWSPLPMRSRSPTCFLYLAWDDSNEYCSIYNCRWKRLTGFSNYACGMPWKGTLCYSYLQADSRTWSYSQLIKPLILCLTYFSRSWLSKRNLSEDYYMNMSIFSTLSNLAGFTWASTVSCLRPFFLVLSDISYRLSLI